MDTIMPYVVQVLLLAMLVVYFALLGVAAYAVWWFARRLVYDHFSVRQAWHDGTSRLLGTHH